MNLWFRLIWYIATHPWRARLDLPHDTSRLRFRVWPHDIDLSAHLNNARYLALMDIGRMDTLISGGLLGTILRHRWTPVANAIEIRFRRELRLFEKMDLQTRIVGWRDNEVFMEQVFVIASGKRTGQVAARALFTGGLYDRKERAFIEITRLMLEISVTQDPPPLQPETIAFLESIKRLRDVDRQKQS